MTTDNDTIQYVDDELPEDLPQPDRTAYMRLADIGFVLPVGNRRKSRENRGLPIFPQYHAAWEPKSFRQEFSRETYPDRADDYTHDWLHIYTNDRQPVAPFTDFGKVAQAWKENIGVPLTKNDVFRPQLIGHIYKVRQVMEETPRKNDDGSPMIDPATGKPVMFRSYYCLPLELADDYVPPADVPVVRYGFKGGGIAQAEVTPEQIAALKAALNGKAEHEYTNAIIDSGNQLIIGDPFLPEAAAGAPLTERLVRYGGEVVAGRIVFRG